MKIRIWCLVSMVFSCLATTATSQITGSGTAQTVPQFTGTSSIGNSSPPITQNGTTTTFSGGVTANVNGVISVTAPVPPATTGGAVGDFNASALGGCTINSMSLNTLNCAAGVSASMVGLVAYIPMAGPMAGSMTSPGAFVTTISAYVNSTTLTLSPGVTTAVTTPENVGVGHDNTAAIQSAISYCYTNKCAVYFPANSLPTGSVLGAVTSASGGSISGVGTCSLTGFNGGGTGASVTVTFTTSGDWATATFATTAVGYGFTTAPTTATLSSVTATCPGSPTVTVTTSLSPPPQTVYFAASTIDPEGVSIFGPPGAAGYSTLSVVAVRGGPGKDVFAVGDPTSLGYVSPHISSSVHDLGVLVDDSVDCSSNGTGTCNPNRLPGRTVFDVAMANGSSTLNSKTILCQAGDAGQDIVVYGAGTGGGNLYTTVANPACTPGSTTSMNLTAAASTGIGCTGTASLSITVNTAGQLSPSSMPAPSGGTINGITPCMLSGFAAIGLGSGTGATFLVTFTTTGSWTGATLTVANFGSGYTPGTYSATATLSSYAQPAEGCSGALTGLTTTESGGQLMSVTPPTSGGQINGEGSCLLSGFNGGGTGATALVTITSPPPNSWSGATVAVLNPGSGYTSDPTTASLSTYTNPVPSSCSGTPSLAVTVTGGQLTSVSSPSGGAIYGPMACLLSSFTGIGPGTGATVLATFTGSGTWSGATLTILDPGSSYTSGTYPSITATASVYSQQTYLSVMGLPATSSLIQTIGNCAWAYDETTSSNGGPTESDFTNFDINTISGTSYRNNSCGFLYQGDTGPYATRWQHDEVWAPFSFAFIPSNGVVGSGRANGLQNFAVFDHLWISGTYPWLSYGAAQETIRDTQISNIYQGPNILSFTGVTPVPGNWHVDFTEEEGHSNTCSPGWTAYRISGEQMIFDRMGAPDCTGTSGNPGLGLQWDASYSTVRSISFGQYNPVEISGTGNSFAMLYGNTTTTASGWNVTGSGNTFLTCGVANPIDGIEPPRCQYAGGVSTAVGPPQLSRGAIAFNRTHDFIDKGAANYYLNSEDLWMWPGEVFGASTGSNESGMPSQISDSTSQTGVAWQLPSCSASCTTYTLTGSNATTWFIGSQIPAGPMRIYFRAEALGSGTTTLKVDATWAASGSPTMSLSCGGTMGGIPKTLTTSYVVYSCDANTSGEATGYRFGITLNGTTTVGGTAQAQIAWIAIKPWNTDADVTSLTVGTGNTPMTTSVGNGAAAQETTTATKTPNDVASFDSTGNTVDSGILQSDVQKTTSATKTANDVVTFDGSGNTVDSGIPSSAIIPTPSVAAGDLLCAHGGDTTIRATTITGGSCSGSSCTPTFSSVPADFLNPSQIVGFTGVTGCTLSGSNPYTLTGATSTSVTFANTASTCTFSGGTLYLTCENSSDATGGFSPSNYFQHNKLALPAFVAGRAQQHSATLNFFSTATAAPFIAGITISTSSSPGFVYLPYSSYETTPAGSLTGVSAQLAFTLLPLAIGSNGPLQTSQIASWPTNGYSNAASTLPAMLSINTSSTWNAWAALYFGTTGVGAGTYASCASCSFTGTIGQTCTLTFTGGTSSGAALVPLTGTNTIANSTAYTIINTGYGYSSAPTTASLSVGTGTATACSGSPAVSTVRGGAQGNAVQLVAIQ